MRRQILFRVDANNQIGWGHFYRCLSLAQMLDTDFDIIFAISDPENDSINILLERQYLLIKLPKFNYSNLDKKVHAEFDLNILESLTRVDIVVLDGYCFDLEYQDKLRKFKLKTVIIEDAGKGNYHADLVVNQAPGLSRLKYTSDSPKTMFALGPEFTLLRPKFLSAARKPKEPLESINSVFICFGGADFHNLSLKFTDYFLTKTKINVHLVVGSSYNFLDSLKNLTVEYGQRFRVDIGLSEESMIFSMKSADFGIVPSSGILFESITCGLPVISGYYVDNQKSIYNGFLKLGAFVDAQNLKYTKIESLMDEFFLRKLNSCIEQHVKIIDGYSNNRLVKCFKSLAN